MDCCPSVPCDLVCLVLLSEKVLGEELNAQYKQEPRVEIFPFAGSDAMAETIASGSEYPSTSLMMLGLVDLAACWSQQPCF